MKKIIVASANPTKTNAALNAFHLMFPSEKFSIEGVSVSSGINDQPMSDEETFQGAWNRVENLLREIDNADFTVGIEGGIEEKQFGMAAFAWAVVKSRSGIVGAGRTATFFLPQKVADLIREGKSLGEADNIVFGRINSQQEQGAIGLLTNGILDRTKYSTDAVLLALIPFNKNLDLIAPTSPTVRSGTASL
jgi:inosine/xanthosine triphosphatase